MQVEQPELIPLSEFRRELPTLIAELQNGEREKVVVTKHGKLECVVVAVPTYEVMANA